jgi:hypothetical protein
MDCPDRRRIEWMTLDIDGRMLRLRIDPGWDGRVRAVAFEGRRLLGVSAGASREEAVEVLRARLQ